MAGATAFPSLLLLVAAAIWRLSPTPPWFVRVLSLGIPALMAYSFGTVATSIDITQDGQVVFTSLFRTKTIRLADISLIDLRKWNRGLILVRAPGTRVFFLRNMPGALDAMTRLGTTHPSIRLKQ